MMKSVVVLMFPFIAHLAIGQANEQKNSTVSIQRAIDEMTVDGVLDEKSWSIAKPAENFWLNAPSDNAMATNATIVRITYDDKNIYIGALMKGPKEYIIQSLKRDSDLESSDSFGVLLDPVGQKSLGYTFGVNVGGAQTEAMVSAAQGQFVEAVDPSWDARWYSAIGEIDEGWIVEIAIPFKSVRFKQGATQWGINFWRSPRF